MEVDIRYLKSDLDSTIRDIESLEDQIAEAVRDDDVDVFSLERELQFLRSDKDSFEMKLDSFYDQIDALEKDVSDLDSDVSDKKHSYEDLLDKLDSAKLKLDELGADLDEAL